MVVALAGTGTIAVVAGLAGSTAIAIGAAVFFLFAIAAAAYKRLLHRQLGRSVEATRHLHVVPADPLG